MWKKIIYYVAMVVVGVLFMMSFSMVQIENTYVKLVNNAINSDNYTDILGLYTSFGNSQAVYSKDIDDTKIRVFETASVRDRTENDNTYGYLDFEYSIFIASSTAKANDQQTEEGKEYNKKGFKIGDFVYYANGFENGMILSSDDPNYEACHNIYGDYNNLLVDTSSLNIIQYVIPYDFINTYASVTSFDKIEILDATGASYATIEGTFNYDSTFFTEIKSLKDVHNDASKNNKTDEFDEYYNTWKTTYNSTSSHVTAYSQGDVFKAGFYVKLVLMVVAYIIIMLIIGDILVGKKRIIDFFRNISNKSKSKDVNEPIEAEARIVNDDVKEDK
ncbi:MAG: hypothetical protein ACI35W_04945 [Anaeroplasmataceae bacterium]